MPDGASQSLASAIFSSLTVLEDAPDEATVAAGSDGGDPSSDGGLGGDAASVPNTAFAAASDGGDAAGGAAKHRRLQTTQGARDKLINSLRKLSSAMLRASSAGDPTQSIKAGPASAFNRSGGYCGSSGLSMAAVRLSVLPSDDVVEVVLPESIAPCVNSSGAAAAAGEAAATVILQIPAETLFSHGNARSTVDVQLVQWGNSPVPESPGWDGMRFVAVHAADARRRLQWSQLPSFAAPRTRGLQSGAGAGAGAGASLLFNASAAPDEPTVASPNEGKVLRDLLPARGLDSRAATINFNSRGGRPLEMADLPQEFVITIPLKDAAAARMVAGA